MTIVKEKSMATQGKELSMINFLGTGILKHFQYCQAFPYKWQHRQWKWEPESLEAAADC
jgi:hypothetical protein